MGLWILKNKNKSVAGQRNKNRKQKFIHSQISLSQNEVKCEQKEKSVKVDLAANPGGSLLFNFLKISITLGLIFKSQQKIKNNETKSNEVHFS